MLAFLAGLLMSAGLDREPELLAHVFTCLSLIFKHLARPLSADLLPPLRCTARLRHHRAEHVQFFAAEALGYLFRQVFRGWLFFSLSGWLPACHES